MFTNIYRTLLAALRQCRPSKRPNAEIAVSKEVSDFMSNAPFMDGPSDEGQRPIPCGVGGSIGMMGQGGRSDPNAPFGQVTQNPSQGSRPLQHRAVSNDVRTGGLYDDRIIPGGGASIGMIGTANNRMPFPLTPEEVAYFRDYYDRVFGVEPSVYDAFVKEHQADHAADTLQQLEKTVRKLLSPRLVPANPPTKAVNEMAEANAVLDLLDSNQGVRQIEPPLIDEGGNKRLLSKKWFEWCTERYGCDPIQAWEIGSKKLIDNEFAGKMRDNVEILKWDPANPFLVQIKYNDPGKR